MSTYKTKTDANVLAEFMKSHFAIAPDQFEPVTDGEVSQAFYFSQEGQDKVLRISSQGDRGFRKDKMAYERLRRPGLPIPKVLEIGEVSPGLSFCVSERSAGKTVSKMKGDELKRILPKLAETLDVIHTMPPMGSGYGDWGLDGKGEFETLTKEFENYARPDDDRVTSANFYDAVYHQKLRTQIKELSASMPDHRSLVHSDFGYDNVTSDGRDITGVFDWDNSKYGDPLFDVAWLDFWVPSHNFGAYLENRYRQMNNLPADFSSRVYFYKLMIGYGSLAFFALSRQPDKYEYARGVIESFRRN